MGLEWTSMKRRRRRSAVGRQLCRDSPGVQGFAPPLKVLASLTPSAGSCSRIAASGGAVASIAADGRHKQLADRRAPDFRDRAFLNKPLLAFGERLWRALQAFLWHGGSRTSLSGPIQYAGRLQEMLKQTACRRGVW